MPIEFKVALLWIITAAIGGTLGIISDEWCEFVEAMGGPEDFKAKMGELIALAIYADMAVRGKLNGKQHTTPSGT